ncbi:DUF2147 domain-containing protein [Pukyongia salina]|uniref:DUF2147 domain-containing protein n=1 Tax=Pukyongia salina TaxID=2094025 RepID=A0A2S0I0S8_9FLAO|nr:DUF2147 domain-containing protein [Pukyongia salina]AVI52223.1 DUF2147 domain-containing protein [Pukyongia salina]
MKLLKNLILFVALSCGTAISAQDVFGKWKTIDDKTGVEKSIVEIYKRNGKVYGKVVEILVEGRQDAKCMNCEGEDEDKPIMGLEIIRGLEKDGDEYNSGKILDPETGKLYKCYIELEETDKLKVRGYIGFSLIGRTQYWYRVK